MHQLSFPIPCVQSTIWEEYRTEADALDKKVTAVLDERKAKRAELVRARAAQTPAPFTLQPLASRMHACSVVNHHLSPKILVEPVRVRNVNC